MVTWLRERAPRGRLSLTLAALVALMALPPTPAQAGLTEKWYLLRARANMEIRNYQAAIEAYRKVVEDDPDHAEALKGLGVAYEANGQTDEAVGAFDRYLARHPGDVEVAFKQARTLGWSRYAYRRADAIRYYRLGLEREDRPAERQQLARLLAQDKSTLDEALAEYRTLLERRPDDAPLRAEYRKLLRWDPRHRKEAIREYQKLAAERPSDRATALELARLLAQEPGRTDEAAAHYHRLVEQAPADRAVRLEYARLLARDPARSEEAREELERAMQGKPDYPTRVLYADLLAADEDERDAALAEYRSLLATSPKDTGVRLKYARLLGGTKESNPEAITQYQQVLAQQPDHGEAHAGLARAYAWQGDADRALHHNRQALAHGAQQADLQTLKEDLETGREPRLGGGVRLLVQPGGVFHLVGFQLPAQGRADVTPFVTLSAEAGFEHYWGPDAQSASGAFVSAGAEARFGPLRRARLGLGLHTLRPGAEALTVRAELEHRDDTLVVRPSFQRQPLFDSLRSLAGARGRTPGTGAVSANVLALHLERQHPRWRTWVVPQLGAVAGLGVESNVQLGLGGGAELALLAGGPWGVAVGYDAQGSHYGSDQSSFTSGGYFSPALYLAQTPRLTVRHVVAGEHAVEVSGGPSLQYQLLHGGAGSWLPGGQGRLAAGFRLARDLEWSVGAALVRMGDAYLRLDGSTALHYVF